MYITAVNCISNSVFMAILRVHRSVQTHILKTSLQKGLHIFIRVAITVKTYEIVYIKRFLETKQEFNLYYSNVSS